MTPTISMQNLPLTLSPAAVATGSAGDSAAAPDAQLALREAAQAAAEAAERARDLAVRLDDALAVLAGVESVTGTANARASGPESARILAAPEHWAAGTLSPREREVLALLAEGRTNKAIAATLFVSPNTVKTHVAALLHKLHADSRVQLAAMAATHRLPRDAATTPS